MDPSPLRALHTLAEVAKQTGRSLRSLEDGARARKFRHVRHGGRRYMTDEQIAALTRVETVEPVGDDRLAGARERLARLDARAPRPRKPRSAA